MGNDLSDLHVHLYGCLELDDLRWMASRNAPRAEFYRESFLRTHGKEPPLREIFDRVQTETMSAHYYMRSPADFADFQTRFDLIISLSRTDPEELYEISRRVLSRQENRFAEYRMMFSPFLNQGEFIEKLDGLTSGFLKARKETGKRADLAISLPRRPDLAESFYRWLRDYMRKHRDRADIITAIDFCAQEEGDPPRNKAKLFEEVLQGNREDPATAVSILYHVGESFSEKTVESAVRWIYEAVHMGSHRIGHAVALGMKASSFLNAVRSESVLERRDHLVFLLNHLEELQTAGSQIERRELEQELQELKDLESHSILSIQYDERRVNELQALQNRVGSYLKQLDVPVETCPTSNLRIAGIGEWNKHPLPRFLEMGIPVVIGSDDPGMLETNIEKETSLALWLSGERALDMEKRIKDTENYTSRKLSGRTE